MLKVEGVNQYYGGSHILRNVAFEAKAGEVWTTGAASALTARATEPATNNDAEARQSARRVDRATK